MNTCTGHDISTELHSYNSSIHSLIFTIVIHNIPLSTLESSSSMPLDKSKMRNRDHQWLLIKQSSGGELFYLQGEKDTVTHFILPHLAQRRAQIGISANTEGGDIDVSRSSGCKLGQKWKMRLGTFRDSDITWNTIQLNEDPEVMTSFWSKSGK